MSEARCDCVDPPTIPAYLDAHMAAHRVVCAFSMIQTRWQIDAIAEAFQRVAVAAEQARADWAGVAFDRDALARACHVEWRRTHPYGGVY